MNNQHPRILIIYPYPSIDTNPTMAFLLELLAARKVEVDVLFEKSEKFLQPESFGATVHLESVPSLLWNLEETSTKDFPKRTLKKLLEWYTRQTFSRNLPKRTLLKLLSSERYYAPLGINSHALKLVSEKRYSVIIGVDPFGITFADRLNTWARTKLAYISFEMILSEDVVSDHEKNLKRMEQIACQRSSLVLIQDDERAAVFCQDNFFPYHKIVKVPVAPPPQEVVKSNYLRETLGIPSGKRIVLYSGALEVWASREQLAEMVSYWSDNYCLVIHLRSKVNERMARFLRGLTETGRIYVSVQPVARADMPGLVASADFGLAPYQPVPEQWWTDRNLYHLGLASGKVAYYAMCGLPILARSLPVFDREFAPYRCGKVYRRLAETGQMLEEMNRNYAVYSNEARRFYRERLNPLEGMERFCDNLINLAVTE